MRTSDPKVFSVHLENEELRRENAALRVENERLRTCERLAYRDDLTSLYNRRYFEERARQEVSRSSRQGSALAVIFLDIDRFKDINDQAGHAVGDRVLVQLGRVLQESCRGADIACRIGGDEFALIVPDTDRAGATALMERVLERLSKEYDVLGIPRNLRTGFSYGIAIHPGDGTSIEQLAEGADQAMYAHKRERRAAIEVLITTDLLPTVA
jgi:diguanylate cyclase (GGDEF)-like protein